MKDDNLSGAMFPDNAAKVLGRGNVKINGEKVFCAIVESKDRKGDTMRELMVSAGKVYINKPENKPKESSPDLGGNIMLNGMKYRFSGWNNVSQNGNEYVSVKLKENETPF